MKKVLSLFMVVCLALSCCTTVLADETKSTTVRVVGESEHSYELTVPLTMTAGETKTTTLEGTWDSATTIKVTAPDSVTLVNDSNGDEKVLDVTYSGFEVVGNDFTSIEEESDITVSDVEVLFGTWDGIIIYNLVVEAVESGPSLVHNGTIPEGGTYYVGIDDIDDNADGVPDGAYYARRYIGADETYTTGDAFPEIVNIGDRYVYGDYEYCYSCYNNIVWYEDSFSGWGVYVLDDSKTEYGEILLEINGKPVTNMSYTFEYCSSLATAPVIPDSVTNMNGTFNSCISLVTAPVIPASVTNMNGTFGDCEFLTNAPVIPTNVTDISLAFSGCTSLTDEIEINASNLTDYDGCFAYTTQPITLTGTCPQLADIAAEYDNVTVKE